MSDPYDQMIIEGLRDRLAVAEQQAADQEAEIVGARLELDRRDKHLTEQAAEIARLRTENEQLRDWQCTVTAALRRPAGAFYSDVPKHVRALVEVAAEANAVCACGCPEGDHETYDEDGQSCTHDDHCCVRTSAAVLSMLETSRRELAGERSARTHLEGRIRELVEQWREASVSRPLASSRPTVDEIDREAEARGWRHCARELAALLSAAPPPQEVQK